MTSIAQSATRRRGFTLAEVLVTLAIIAVMAAVLLPALNSQLSKGDTGRLVSDLTSIQTGAQAFVSDVHRYPLNISDLTTNLTASSTDITGTDVIPAALAAMWKGPYIGRDIVDKTGAGGTISPQFTRVTGDKGTTYLTVQVTGVSETNFNNIDLVLDNGVAGSSTGLALWKTASSTLQFLAMPIP